MKNSLNKNTSYKNKGFTLIETAIFLTIVSMVLATSLNTYRTYKMKEALGKGKYRSSLIANKLGAFIGHYGELPCPADPSLPPSDINAGKEQCIQDAPFNIAVGSCNSAVCRVAGKRDTDVDPDFTVNNLLIGAVPYLTLGITREDSMDGWGGTFTYAVSEDLTNPTDFTMERGVIDRQERQGSDRIATDPPVGTISTTASATTALPNSFMVAVMSHGENNRGAYNYAGSLIEPCVDPDNVGTLDEENCNGDGSFLDTYKESEIYNLNKNSAEFFDDRFAFFNVINDADKWMYTSGNSMTNKLGGNVGIGITSADEALHVVGNIKAVNYQSDKICDSDGSDCFNPNIITGTGINCAGGLMTGVSSGNTICQEIVGTDNIVTDSCPTGHFMKGIDAGGVIVCEE
ncbi:MAG: prepilin-type N-terminal cleavage/methylation domain-containing protein [Gammaproteobacteria bacterium]|nr:prepilin-type N-terminal cleavage/methylation domain-containing protein [Gammaproteobacteria bacterium]